MEVLNSVLAQLGVDGTFFHQFVLIFTLYAVLTQVLWKPLRRTIGEREKATVEAKKVALDLERKAKEALELYETQMEGSSREANGLFKKAKEEALLKQGNVIHSAEEEYRNQVARAREEAEKELADIRDNLKKDSEEIAKLMLGKVLGR